MPIPTDERISQIRNLLDQIELESASIQNDSFERNFDALELPDLICQVVDYLQPRLFPYESAIYWYMFRHSIVGNSSQHVRVSVRGLGKKVIKSSSGQSETLSYGTVQDALRGLEEKLVIRKDGDTTREGTPYLVLLPEEIPFCIELIRESVENNNESNQVDEMHDVDFYNIPENRIKVFERDNYKCKYCGRQLTRFSATLDHLQPVSQNGLNTFENLITACLHCNSRRGARPAMDAILMSKE